MTIDVLEITHYLSRRSPAAAARFTPAPVDTLDWLADHAESGSPKVFPSDPDLTGFRSWAVQSFPRYLILYQVGPRDLDVHAVVQGSRNLPAVLRERV